MSHEDPMPFQVKEMFRQGLKNKETMLRLFDDARKIVKEGIVDARKIFNDPSSNSLELSHAVTTYLLSVEKLRRIDDFEMIHLNMIDLQEQIAENNGQKTSMEKNSTKIDEEKLLRGFKSYCLDEFKLNFGVLSAKFKKSRD